LRVDSDWPKSVFTGWQLDFDHATRHARTNSVSDFAAVAFACPGPQNDLVGGRDCPCGWVKLTMSNKLLAQMLFAAALVVASCGRDGLAVSAGRDASPDQAKDAGGSRDVGGSPGFGGGRGGGLGFQFPDGGLGGLLGGILDAPRDNLLGQLLCGPEVRMGASCSSNVLGCVLPSFGGLCLCTSGVYVCPLNTGPLQDCPRGAATGTKCISPLSACLGGSGVGCICELGTYACL
jgi:hypothetical protein